MPKKNVKERITETASRLFYENGYNQTGINQIIEEAGVAKASMYQHFRSKEDIAVAYLQQRHKIWMGKLEDFISDRLTPKTKAIACFDFLLNWLTEVNFRGCGWQNIIVDLPKDQQKIKDQAVYHKNELRNWLQDLLKQDKENTNESAEELANEILVLMEGALILSQINKGNWPINSAKKACITLLG